MTARKRTGYLYVVPRVDDAGMTTMAKLTSATWWFGKTPEQRERKQRARDRWHEIRATENGLQRAGRKVNEAGHRISGTKRGERRGWFFFWWG